MAVLMLTVRIGYHSLLLACLAEAGAANIGFPKQKILLDDVRKWIPTDAAVMLLADYFYTRRWNCFNDSRLLDGTPVCA